MIGWPSSDSRGHEIEGVALVVLADAVDAAEALFQARRVPRHVVIDHQVAELEVDALAGSLGRDADLPGVRKSSWARLPLMRVHAAVNFAGGSSPTSRVLPEILQRVAVLGEDQQLAAAILKFIELRSLKALAQGLELGIVPVSRTRRALAEQVP